MARDLNPDRSRNALASFICLDWQFMTHRELWVCWCLSILLMTLFSREEFRECEVRRVDAWI